MTRLPGALYLISALCLFAILAALVMQYRFDMAPCPLCISQRVFVILLGIFALLAGLSFRLTLLSRTLMTFAIVAGVIGASVSGRHVWIQNLPEDKVPGCGPSLAYMFETRPMFDALNLLFKGDGHCADVSFTLLGLSIPAWTLVLFLTLTVALIFLLTRELFSRRSQS